MKQEKRELFPFGLFSVYVVYFAGQAIYNTYLNLYLYGIGFSASQIGRIISVSTLVLLVAQTFWGFLSDRVQVKNRVVRFLYVAAACCALGFYQTTSYWMVLALVTLFSAVFIPIVPLNDNIALESLTNSSWDYGWIRMGGTIGYAVSVIVIGYVLKDTYSSIFWMVALAMSICFFCSLMVSPVKGYRGKKKRSSIKKVFANKTLMGLIGFNLIYGLGVSFFYNFYPIHFINIGGNSQMVGWMMFACSIAEIPCLIFMRRIVKKIGVDKVLILSGILTCVRWSLLFLLKTPVLIIVVNLLHGFSFAGITYCLLNYINNRVPGDLRASSQVLNVTMGTVFSKLVFGYVGGIVFERWGAEFMLICSAITIGLATVMFTIWSRERREELSF